ncbi:MAG: hypothetical protein ACRCU5_10920 [Rhizobiaceae bacterium]
MKKSALVASLVFLASMSGQAYAADNDTKFFKQAQGKWSGPGEIVAGKYKGTKFVCTFDGSTHGANSGMTMDGSCRVGVFNQEMKATVQRANGKYTGAFLDGAKGKGLDIVAGNVSGNRVTFALNRKQLNGAMLAKLTSDNTMNVNISVRVNKDMVPVIGMTLTRIDDGATSGIAKN